MPPGRRPPGREPRERRAHPRRLHRRPRRRGRRARVRRPADRRRPPRLRARPRPCVVRRSSRGLVSTMELAELQRARLRRLEEPLGRPRRRGPRPRRVPRPRAHPAQAARDRRRLRPPRRGRRSRPSTPPATAAWSSGAWSRCCATSAGTSAARPVRRDELLLHRAAARRADGAGGPAGAAGRPRPVLVDAAPRDRPRLDRRPRHRAAARAPAPGHAHPARGTVHVWTVNTAPDLELCVELGRQGRHHRPPGLHAASSSDR